MSLPANRSGWQRNATDNCSSEVLASAPSLRWRKEGVLETVYYIIMNPLYCLEQVVVYARPRYAERKNNLDLMEGN